MLKEKVETFKDEVDECVRAAASTISLKHLGVLTESEMKGINAAIGCTKAFYDWMDEEAEILDSLKAENKELRERIRAMEERQLERDKDILEVLNTILKQTSKKSKDE